MLMPGGEISNILAQEGQHTKPCLIPAHGVKNSNYLAWNTNTQSHASFLHLADIDKQICIMVHAGRSFLKLNYLT